MANNPVIVDLRDFKGADPTGNSESTKAVQQAMIEAVSVGLPLAVFAGLYKVASLNAPTGLVMQGYHPGGYGVGVLKETRIGLIENTNAHLLIGSVGAGHVRISNIHFDGNKNNNTIGNIIHLEDASPAQEGQWHIRDCFIDAAAGHGIYIGAGRRAVQVSDCTINYSRQNGIRVNGSDAHIDRCILGSNMGHGIGVGGTVCNVNDCDIYGNGTKDDNNTGDGIVVYSTITMVCLRGNRLDQNRRNGILVSQGCEAINVANNIMHGNSQHGDGKYSDINVQSTASSINISGNAFGVNGNVPHRPGYAIRFAPNARGSVSANVIQKGATVNGLIHAA